MRTRFVAGVLLAWGLRWRCARTPLCRDPHGCRFDAGGRREGDRRGRGRRHRPTPRRNGRVDEGMEHRPWGQDEGHHHPGGRNRQDGHLRQSSHEGCRQDALLAGRRGRKTIPRHGHHLRRHGLCQCRSMGRHAGDHRQLQELSHRSLQVQERRPDDEDQRRHLRADRPLLFSRHGIQGPPRPDDPLFWPRRRELPQTAQPGHCPRPLFRGQRGPFQPGGGQPGRQQPLDRALRRRGS